MTDADLWWCQPELPLPHWPATPAAGWVRLRPLRYEDAEGYLAASGEGASGAGGSGAGGSAEIFRWLSVRAPRDLADARRHVGGALAARARGERLPYAQLDPTTGQFLGTTSLYELDPARRSVAIGHTWLSSHCWRTGVNTSSKLQLLRYCFDELGAVRVVWHTDALNARSRAAILRLGATFEGTQRKHRQRSDGSWRDTVQFAVVDEDWPRIRAGLEAALVRA